MNIYFFPLVLVLVILVVSGCDLNTNCSRQDPHEASKPSLRKPVSTLATNVQGTLENVDRAGSVRHREELDAIARNLTTNFGGDGVKQFSTEMFKILNQMPDAGASRSELARTSHEIVTKLTMPKLVSAEESTGWDPDLTNELTSVVSLIESQWRIDAAAGHLVDGFDLSRPRYFLEQSNRWKSRGLNDMSDFYASLARRMTEQIESPSGSIRQAFESFEKYAVSDSTTDAHAVVLVLKAYLANDLLKGVGHYPRWAEDWQVKHKDHVLSE